MQLKGKSVPIRMFHYNSAPVFEEMGTTEVLRHPLIGHEQLLLRFRNRVSKMNSDSPSSSNLLIEGREGMGKSRILSQFAKEACALGVPVSSVRVPSVEKVVGFLSQELSS